MHLVTPEADTDFAPTDFAPTTELLLEKRAALAAERAAEQRRVAEMEAVS